MYSLHDETKICTGDIDNTLRVGNNAAAGLDSSGGFPKHLLLLSNSAKSIGDSEKTRTCQRALSV